MTAVALAVAWLAGGTRPVTHAQSAPVTFTKHIAPIVFTHCGSCHRPGGPAPFSLVTYAAARQRAMQMASVTRRRVMPPWKADVASGEFAGMEPLGEHDIALIERWVEGGAPQGELRDLPPLPRWPDGWQLGTPDLIVQPPAYTLPADGTDRFRIFVVPLPVGRTRFVKGLEFRPGSGQAVHHATIRIDPTSNSRQFDDEDASPGYSGLIARTAGYPDGHFLGWTPGQVPPLLPKGLAWTLEPGTDLVIELHLQPTGKPEQVQPSIGLYFSDDPPERTPAMLRLGRQSLDIAPGASRYVLDDSFLLPVAADVQAIQPHAHYRARHVSSFARLPDGTTRKLIDIADWDFRWQHVYRFVKPVPLPQGTVVVMRYTYDNSTENPRNLLPLTRVHWGQRSSDEMGDLWVQVLTRTERDREALNQAMRAKMMAEDLIGYRARIAAEPSDGSLRDDVALLYLEMGKPEEAVAEFTVAAGLRPDSAAAQYNLGYALARAGRPGEAIGYLRQALKLRPDYVFALNTLGGLLLQAGQLDEALLHLREAVRLDPSYRPARDNLRAAERLLARE